MARHDEKRAALERRLFRSEEVRVVRQRSGGGLSAIRTFLNVGACTVIARAESAAAFARVAIDFTAPSTVRKARSRSGELGTRRCDEAEAGR